jgi:hypothetical protein
LIEEAESFPIPLIADFRLNRIVGAVEGTAVKIEGFPNIMI